MKWLEHLLTYGPFSNGKEIGDWDSVRLHEKMIYTGEAYTFAERHALEFFQSIGEVMEKCHPTEK